ncbi:hypothetical protein ACCO45_013375 [Purpureocillium lilacinum]|uniref:Uncharacterized protein n=1 Tax=Purpureocillium lilacinum TaxID=33203 RepID=A0ACC4D6K0_PURLI
MAATPMGSVGSGLASEGIPQRTSTPTKPVAQASRRTGAALRRLEASPATADGWVLWAAGRWRALHTEQGEPTTLLLTRSALSLRSPLPKPAPPTAGEVRRTVALGN